MKTKTTYYAVELNMGGKNGWAEIWRYPTLDEAIAGKKRNDENFPGAKHRVLKVTTIKEAIL